MFGFVLCILSYKYRRKALDFSLYSSKICKAESDVLRTSSLNISSLLHFVTNKSWARINVALPGDTLSLCTTMSDKIQEASCEINKANVNNYLDPMV